jgi:hypothetical protein
LTPVDAFQEHRQLRTRQRHRSARRLGPDKASSFQPLLKKTKAITIEPQQLDQITALAAEDEYMTGEWCLLKNRLNDRRESLKAAAQIREPRGNPDPCPCLRFDHRNRLPKTARTSSGSTPASTLITALPGSSIWIDPDGDMAGAIPDNVTLFGSAVTVTGINLVCAR